MKVLKAIGASLGNILAGGGKLLFKKTTIPVGLIILLMVLASGGVAYAIKTNPEAIGLRKGPEDIKREEEALIKEVRSKIDLPSEETPTLATVTDVEKVKDQPFFAKAKNGDRVLIYSNAKKVVLYRPSEARVIEIGTVNIGGTEGVTRDSETPLKFAIFNGTTSTGLTNIMESDLKKIITDADILAKGNALSTDYEKTILVNVVGDEILANDLASKLGIETGELPEGEKSPEGVDFIIIVGKDKVVSNTPQETPTP